ncbi:MAG: hypothetical protein WCK54_09450 [Desulfuromonadales bacterium]
MRVTLKEEGLLEGGDHDSKRRMELLRALKGGITIDYDWEAAEQEELQSDIVTAELHGK